MKSRIPLRSFPFLIIAAVLAISALSASAQGPGALEADAKRVYNNLVARVPAAKALGKDAVAVLVFPKITKAGFVIGGQYGEGVLLKGGKDPTTRRNPLPIPIGKPNPTRDKNWTDFRNDCQNAAIPSPVVAAHTSMDGLLYFDMRSEWELLQTARLYIPNLESMNTHTPLSYFEIELGRGSSN